MTDEILPKYSVIYTINKKRKCKFGGDHQLTQKRIRIYNKSKSYSNEIIFECKRCKKLFIVQGNKERFLNSYPLYIINQEMQDKMLSKKQVQRIVQKERELEAAKKRQEAAKKQREIELAKMNDPAEKRKKKIQKFLDDKNIKVLIEKHNHSPFTVTCSIGNNSVKLSYCEECNLLYCMKDEYEKLINKGISKKWFSFIDVEHVNMTIFNNKSVKEKPKKKKEITNEKESNNIKSVNNIIPKKTLFVKTDSRACINGEHKVKNITVSFDFLNNDGQKIKKNITAFMCSECDITYIYDDQFYNLVKNGQPLCLVIDQTIYRQLSNGKRFHLGTESILTLYGYSVNQNDNLKQRQRQNILKTLINTRIIRKDAAISHLRWLVRQRRNRKNHKNAIARWEADIDFLINYDVDNSISYSIETIINKSRRY